VTRGEKSELMTLVPIQIDQVADANVRSAITFFVMMMMMMMMVVMVDFETLCDSGCCLNNTKLE
jgi:hypothetical protein